MKKSKVLIPAMALLVFSTAASISSTVAWFSATRVFKLDAGNFQVAQLEGSLAADVTSSVGTFKDANGKIVFGVGNDNDASEATIEKNRLLDASYNAVVGATGNAYRLNREGGAARYASQGSLTTDAAGASEAKDKATPGSWLHPTTTGAGTAGDPTLHYYVAAHWQITFTYDFATEDKDVGIFLDLNSAMSSFGATSTDLVKDAASGMRIAFVASDNFRVWGNHVPVTVKEAFNVANDYAADEIVSYQGFLWKANGAITAGDWDAGEWTKLPYAVRFDDAPTAWDSANAYNKDARVSKDGRRYFANKAIAASTDWDDDNWIEDETLLRYVNGTASSALGYYTQNNYIYTQTLARANDGVDPSTRKDYICTIDNPGSSTEASTTIDCVAWFEGEDPNVVNGTAMTAVGASMTFYARTLNA